MDGGGPGMKYCKRSIFFAFSALFSFFSIDRAEAINFTGFSGTVINFGGTQNGQCSLANQSLFSIQINSQFVGDTDDGGGLDHYEFYMVDGNNIIIDGNFSSVNAAGGNVAGGVINFQTFVQPTAGPFRFMVLDTAVGAQTQADGATFNLTPAVTITVDLSQLNPFCPGVAGTANSSTSAADIAVRVNKQKTKQALDNLMLHLLRFRSNRSVSGIVLDDGGEPDTALSVSSAAAETGGRAAYHFESAFDDDRNEGWTRRLPSALSQETGWGDRNVGTNDTRQALKFLIPYLAFDTAAVVKASAGQGDSTPSPTEPAQFRRDLRASLWMQGSVSSIENTRNNVGDDRRFSGDTLSLSVGADYWFTDRLLSGVFLNVAESDLDVTSDDGTYRDLSYTLAPYLLYKPQSWLDLTVTAGFGFHDVDRASNISSAQTNSNTSAYSGFASVSAAAHGNLAQIPEMRVTGSLSFTRSMRRDDSYTDSGGTFFNSTVTNSGYVQLDGEAAYEIDAGGGLFVEPYASSALVYEFLDTTNGDGESGEVGGGVRLIDVDLALQASVDASTVVGLDDYSESTISGTVARTFSVDLFGANQLAPSLSLGSSIDAMNTTVGARLWNDSSSARLDLQSNLARTYSNAGNNGPWRTYTKLNFTVLF